jgi:hypothetical protein
VASNRPGRVCSASDSARRSGGSASRRRQRVAEPDILSNIGIGEPIPVILKYAIPRGAMLGSHNRLCFPRALGDLTTIRMEIQRDRS